MIHPIIIDPLGKTQRNNPNARLARVLRATMLEIDKWDLKPQKYYMNEADFYDIVKWGKE
jgi:hypothetical protein